MKASVLLPDTLQQWPWPSVANRLIAVFAETKIGTRYLKTVLEREGFDVWLRYG